MPHADDFNSVYGEDDTAPCAIGLNKATTLDAACQRWAGSILNHTTKKKANMLML